LGSKVDQVENLVDRQIRIYRLTLPSPPLNPLRGAVERGHTNQPIALERLPDSESHAPHGVAIMTERRLRIKTDVEIGLLRGQKNTFRSLLA